MTSTRASGYVTRSGTRRQPTPKSRLGQWPTRKGRYKGIGSAKGLGKRNVPFCAAPDEGALAKGTPMSNELKSHLHCVCISEGFALMDDRQIKVGKLNKDGLRRGQLVSGQGSIPSMICINIEGQLPDEDEDADNGRFGADLPMVQAMYTGAALDPDPGPSISTGDETVFVIELAGEACLGLGTRARRVQARYRYPSE